MFKERGPSSVADFKGALHLNKYHGQKRRFKTLIVLHCAIISSLKNFFCNVCLFLLIFAME